MLYLSSRSAALKGTIERMATSYLGALASLSLVVVSGLAAQESQLVSGRDAQARKAATERWIVEFERGVDLTSLREANSGPAAVSAINTLKTKLARERAGFVESCEKLGGRVVESFWLIDAMAVDVPAGSVEALADLDGVLRVHRNELKAPSFAPIKTSTNANNIASDVAHQQGLRGKGVTVAIVDSGLDIDMKGTKRPHRLFYVNGDPKNGSGGGLSGSRILRMRKIGQQPVGDAIGHGTAVAAVAVGEVWGSSGSDRGHAYESKVTGYSIADLTNGLATLATMGKAFQQVVLDAKADGTKVVNMSYEGTMYPLSLEQQAIDAAAVAADLVITVSAGNRGVSTGFAHGSYNRLAVGSVHHDTRAVASFSARGGLPTNRKRVYPSLVANGVNMVLPIADAEGQDITRSGGSYAAPAVAGLAAQYRAAKPAASALETRAAILATTEDIAGANRTPPYNTKLAYGHGYARADKLAALAQGKVPSAIFSSIFRNNSQLQRFPVNLVAGKHYAVVVTWNRQRSNLDQVSQFTVVVQDPAVFIGTEQGHGTVAKAVVRATRSGRGEIMVVASRLETSSVPISVVLVEVDAPFRLGKSVAFGKSCAGSGPLEPAIGAIGAFEIGTSYSVDVSRIGQRAPYAVVVGLSASGWGGVTLPLDLRPFGAPGCWLYASIDSLLVGVSDGLGRGRAVVPLPNDRSLVWTDLFHQALVPSNRTSLGLLTSSALRIEIGGNPR